MAEQKNDDSKQSNNSPPIKPNILITGTPGVGKSSLAEALCEETQLKNVDINLIIQTQKFYEGKDEKRDCLIVDEEKLMDYIEDNFVGPQQNGNVFDTHLCCFEPKWVDLVIVLRCDNTLLFDRLKERNYSNDKIQENVEAEIMQIILDEALETFDKDIVIQLQNDTIEQQEHNINKIKQWIQHFHQKQLQK